MIDSFSRVPTPTTTSHEEVGRVYRRIQPPSTLSSFPPSDVQVGNNAYIHVQPVADTTRHHTPTHSWNIGYVGLVWKRQKERLKRKTFSDTKIHCEDH